MGYEDSDSEEEIITLKITKTNLKKKISTNNIEKMEDLQWIENLSYNKMMLINELKSIKNINKFFRNIKKERISKLPKNPRGRKRLHFEFDYKSRDPENIRKITQYKKQKNNSYPDRLCELCNCMITYEGKYQHQKTMKHIKNELKHSKISEQNEITV